MESEIDKKLGITCSQDVEKMGIAKYVSPLLPRHLLDIMRNVEELFLVTARSGSRS